MLLLWKFFLFDYVSLQSPSVGSSVAGKESPHRLSLEYKQLKKSAFPVVVFPQETHQNPDRFLQHQPGLFGLRSSVAAVGLCCFARLLAARERAEQLWY